MKCSTVLSQHFQGRPWLQGHMQDAMQYLNLVETESTGPAAILKYRIYHSGGEGLTEQEPAFPFEDTPSSQLPVHVTPIETHYQPQVQHKAQQLPQDQPGGPCTSFALTLL